MGGWQLATAGWGVQDAAPQHACLRPGGGKLCAAPATCGTRVCLCLKLCAAPSARTCCGPLCTALRPHRPWGHNQPVVHGRGFRWQGRAIRGALQRSPQHQLQVDNDGALKGTQAAPKAACTAARLVFAARARVCMCGSSYRQAAPGVLPCDSTGLTRVLPCCLVLLDATQGSWVKNARVCVDGVATVAVRGLVVGDALRLWCVPSLVAQLYTQKVDRP